MNKIYITDKQNIMENMMLDGDKTEEEATAIMENIFEKIEIGEVPGATTIESTIVADNVVAIRWAVNYGITMEEVDLYKSFEKEKVATVKAEHEGILQ